jgi:hypothetical protein
MIAKCEAQQAWLENVTYQMCNMVSNSYIKNEEMLTWSHTRNNQGTWLDKSLSSRCNLLDSLVILLMMPSTSLEVED